MASARPTTRELLRDIEARTTRSIAAGRDVTSAGVFLAALHPTNDLTWLNFAVPAPDPGERPQPQAIDELRWLFRSKGRRLRFEYVESLWPDLASLLEAHGLVLEGQMPIMICTPESFVPAAAAGLRVVELSSDADDVDFREFLLTAKRGFELDPVCIEACEIEEQREYVRTGVYRCAYALMQGRLVGVGSLTVVNNELAGIATLPEFRRRGVAAAISSHLVKQHFRALGRTPGSSPAYVWLSAGDQVARAVYEKIGFQVAGVQLNYVDSE